MTNRYRSRDCIDMGPDSMGLLIDGSPFNWVSFCTGLLLHGSPNRGVSQSRGLHSKGSPQCGVSRRASADLCGLHCFESRRVIVHCGCCHSRMPCDRHSARLVTGYQLAARSSGPGPHDHGPSHPRYRTIPDGQRGPSRRRTHRHAGPSRHGWLDGHRSALHGRTPRRLGPPGRGPLRAVGLRPGRL